MRAAGVYPFAVTLILVTGCAGTPGGERPEFGSSVSYMKQAQTYSPWEEPPALSGDKAAAAMERYREDVSDPDGFGKGDMEFQ